MPLLITGSDGKRDDLQGGKDQPRREGLGKFEGTKTAAPPRFWLLEGRVRLFEETENCSTAAVLVVEEGLRAGCLDVVVRTKSSD
jgi:hypothetical protein